MKDDAQRSSFYYIILKCLVTWGGYNDMNKHQNGSKISYTSIKNMNEAKI